MSALELRTQSDGTVRLHGLASRFNNGYRIGSERNPFSYVETVKPGAFSQSLSRADLDVVLNVQHDDRLPLARTPVTLRLTQTQTGLEFDADLDPNDSLAQQAISRVQRGVLRECSFRFRIPEGGDRWSDDDKERLIYNADIHRGDVSLVVYGANPETGANVMRGVEASLEERRAYAVAVSARGLGGNGWSPMTGWRQNATRKTDRSSALLLPASKLDEFEVEAAHLSSRVHAAEHRMTTFEHARQERTITHERILTTHLQQRWTNSWRPKD